LRDRGRKLRRPKQSMIHKHGYRLSGKDHASPKVQSAMTIQYDAIALQSMIPKSGNRFSEKDHAPT
jgi:hypothetical protein